MGLTAEIEINTHAHLGEGSLWHAQRRVLYWVDIIGHKVYAYDPRTKINRTYDVGSDVGTVVARKSGGLIVALRFGIASLCEVSGQVTMLKEVPNAVNELRFNDGKCDPAGRFWVGTMGYAFGKGAGALWCFDAKHTLERKVSEITCSNGIVWTSDQKTMYYIDTPTGRVDAFDYHAESGEIRNRRTAVEIGKGDGHPDGMTIDANDNLWVAMWGGWKVIQYDPKSGQKITEIAIPGAERITSCAFGGENLDTLYITSSGGDLKPEDQKKQPNAGCLFVCKPGVKGVPAVDFAD